MSMTALVPPIALQQRRTLAGFTKILVVDDNVAVRGVLTSILNTLELQVITAEDGLLGLQMAEAERPHLIITDIDMPNLDGIQMIARLRQHSELREVPILVISGEGERKASEALEAGANHVMPKPVMLNSFIGLITQLISG